MDLFLAGVLYALVVMLDAMIQCGVQIAVVPGLSTGIYAGKHR